MATRKQARKDFQAKVKKSANKIWLAGLGAFALAEEEGGKLFRSLVHKGEALEQKGLDQVGELRERIEALAGTARDKATEMAGEVEKQATKAWNKVEGNVDDTVNAAFARVGVPTRDEIARLTRRIEELTRQVEKKKVLGRGKKAVGRRAPAKRRTSARKAG